MSTQTEPVSEAVTLIFGYNDGNQTHTEVVFSHRLTGADLLRISDDEMSEKTTQFNLMMQQAAITKFGSLSMPVPMTVLLSLKSPDRQELNKAHNKFLKKTSQGHRSEVISDAKVRLGYGFQIDGATYDVVEFGNLLSGYDELEADEMERWRRACFLQGKQISKLSQSNGQAVRLGPVELEHFDKLDGGDIFVLEAAATRFQDSFRRTRGKVSSDNSGGSRVSDETSGEAGS
jgi:hypothetical protein